jgi:hypothetical protein
VSELASVFDREVAAGDLPPTLRALADLFAWAVQRHAVCEELPALAAAVRADGSRAPAADRTASASSSNTPTSSTSWAPPLVAADLHRHRRSDCRLLKPSTAPASAASP